MILYIIIQKGNLLLTKKLSPLYTKYTPFDLTKCDSISMGNITNPQILREIDTHEGMSYSYGDVRQVMDFLKKNL